MEKFIFLKIVCQQPAASLKNEHVNALSLTLISALSLDIQTGKPAPVTP